MSVRVLHLAHRFYVGGAERQFIERLRRHPCGYEPRVASFEFSGGNLDDFRALGLPQPALFPLGKSMLRPRTLAVVARIAAHIRSISAQIVHGTEFTSNFLGLLAARAAGAKLVASRVDLGHLRAGFGPWHRRVEKWVSRHADAVCANAAAVQKLCIEEEGAAADRTFVVRNGIDLDRFDALAAQPLDAEIPAARPLVAVVANLWPVKGHRTLIEAAALVREAVPQAHFALVGDGPERAWLKERIGQLDLGGHVSLLGTRYDVPAILGRADLACLPSHAEGLPNAVMEAMAARLPVVATSVGGVPELVADGETGLLAPPGDPEALAARLIELLSDAERRRRMGERARTFVRGELSLHRLAAGHGAVYDAVLSVESPPLLGVGAGSP